MRTCKFCRKPIVMGPPTPDHYWYHPHNQSVYCDLRYADATRAKRAIPAWQIGDKV